MTQIHVTRASRMPRLAALAAVGVAVGLGLWWFTAERSASLLQESAAPTGQALPTVQAEQGAQTPASQVSADIGALLAEQQTAAQAIERDPQAQPISGAVTERPEFVSPLEWMMLKGAVENHPAPDRELTRMVNFLRFNKQLELWQAAREGGEAQRRQRLAAGLLDDLPARVAHGDMGLKDAQEVQQALLMDAEPDPEARRDRAGREARRLQDAAGAAERSQPASASRAS